MLAPMTRTQEMPPGAFLPLDEMPRCGVRDLDALHVLRPGAVTLVDQEPRLPLDVFYAWLADAAVCGKRALVADGGNTLDVYRLATAARRRAAARWPDAPRRDLAAFEEAALERVHVARGFTAHQLQSIVEEGLPKTAEDGETIGLVAAPGLMDMYLDEDVAREEARVLAGRALGALKTLARRSRAPCFIVNSVLPVGRPHPLRRLLDEAADEQLLVARAPAGGVRFVLPRRGVQLLAPGPGRTRLEDFADLGSPDAPVDLGIPEPKLRPPGLMGRVHHDRTKAGAM